MEPNKNNPKRPRVVAVQMTAGEFRVMLANSVRDGLGPIIERGLRDMIQREVKAAVAETLQKSAETFDAARASLLEQQRLVARVLGDTDAALVRVEELLGRGEYVPVVKAKKKAKRVAKPGRAKKKTRKRNA